MKAFVDNISCLLIDRASWSKNLMRDPIQKIVANKQTRDRLSEKILDLICRKEN